MNDTIKIKQGDLERPIYLTLTDSEGAAVDLTAADSVKFSMRAVDGVDGDAPLIDERACGMVDAAAGEISITLQAADTETAGLYLAEVLVYWTTGRPQTFPADGTLEIYIVPDLAETAARSDARRRVEIGAATENDPALDSETVAQILDRNLRVDSDGLRITDTGYVESYDILNAIAEAWETKAGLAACRTDISAPGGTKIMRSQVADNCLRMAAQYRRRRNGSAASIGPNGREIPQDLIPVANGADILLEFGEAGGAGGTVDPVPW